MKKSAGRPGGASAIAKLVILSSIALSAFVAAGCKSSAPMGEASLTVTSTSPANLATAVARNRSVTAVFSADMEAGTVNTQTFSLARDSTSIPCVVTCSGSFAILNPLSDLDAGVVYTAVISRGVRDRLGNYLAANKVWSFTTGSALVSGPAPVNLGTALNFAILSKSGIATVPTSAVTGNIGVSPIDSTAITGFSLAMDSSNTFATSSQLVGRAYAADYTAPTPSNLTTAVSDMETAYTDAAGRAIPDFVELGSGQIGGLTLVPGLYKWGTSVLISNDVTLIGGPNDVWIFQISGGITQAAGKRVILGGGALAKNIFWQSFGAVAINTTAHIEGIIMSYTEITLATGASVNGRLLSQTAVTIDSSTVTQPSP